MLSERGVKHAGTQRRDWEDLDGAVKAWQWQCREKTGHAKIAWRRELASAAGADEMRIRISESRLNVEKHVI
jgi:hypothetical protein